MNSVKYRRIFEGVYNLYGIESETAQTTDWNLIRDFTNSRLRVFWETAKWPSITTVEERTVYSDEDEGVYIPLSEPNHDDIYEVYRVYQDNAYTNRTAIEIGKNLTPNGIQLPSDYANETAFVWFKKRKPELTGSAYNASLAYTAGSSVFFTDDFYTALVDIDAGDSPTEYPAGWELSAIPEEAANYLTFSVYGDMLRHNGDRDGAMDAMNQANEFLEIALDGLLRRQDETDTMRVYTYG